MTLTTLNTPMIKPRLHYYDLGNAVTAFTTTRHGGRSEGNFGTLNINPFRGDNPEAVAANLQIVAQELGVSADRIVRQHQVHGTECRQIDSNFFSLSAQEQRQMMEGVDAVMTNLPQISIGVFTADCVPVLLFDPENKATAAIHAGWRGTVQHIVAKTVERMRQQFGTNPARLQAQIAPCISEKNFEVGQEVYDAFLQSGFDMPRIATMHAKWHINLPLANRLDLEGMGVKTENIRQANICTYDNSTDYFSARKLKEGFGTIYTGIILR